MRELIQPGEAPLAGKATLVNLGVEQSLATPFGCFPVALVLGDVGPQPIIEAGLARLAGVKGRIGVEVGSGDGQAEPLQALEG